MSTSAKRDRTTARLRVKLATGLAGLAIAGAIVAACSTASAGGAATKPAPGQYRLPDSAAPREHRFRARPVPSAGLGGSRREHRFRARPVPSAGLGGSGREHRFRARPVPSAGLGGSRCDPGQYRLPDSAAPPRSRLRARTPPIPVTAASRSVSSTSPSNAPRRHDPRPSIRDLVRPCHQVAAHGGPRIRRSRSRASAAERSVAQQAPKRGLDPILQRAADRGVGERDPGRLSRLGQ